MQVCSRDLQRTKDLELAQPHKLFETSHLSEGDTIMRILHRHESVEGSEVGITERESVQTSERRCEFAIAAGWHLLVNPVAVKRTLRNQIERLPFIIRALEPV